MVLLSFNCNYLIKSCACAIIYILFVFYATGKMWSDGIGQEEVEENIWNSERVRGKEGIKIAQKVGA